MSENFPLNKKDIFEAGVNICLKDQVFFWCGKNVKNSDAPNGVNYYNGGGGSRIEKLLPNGEKEHGQERILDDSHIERAFNNLFKYTEGCCDKLRIEYGEIEKNQEESDHMFKYVTDAIANRPISTIFFIQESQGTSLSCPVQVFLRDCVDFSMYAAIHNISGEQSPMEITEKLLRCEFLYLNCYLSNSEVLQDFRGWGLVVFHAEENKINFEFFRKAIEDFISGKDVQWRYLAFEMVPPEDKWNLLISHGKPVTFKFGGENVKEFKLKRTDKEKARIGRIVLVERNYIYFYKGKLTEDMKAMNAQFWRRMF